jgi:hypothetical protein
MGYDLTALAEVSILIAAREWDGRQLNGRHKGTSFPIEP